MYGSRLRCGTLLAAAALLSTFALGQRGATSQNVLTARDGPTRFRCTVTRLTLRGSDSGHLLRRGAVVDRVWRDGDAYRVETRHSNPSAHHGPGSEAVTWLDELVRLNNGDGTSTEFEYFPARRRAHLSLETVQFHFAAKHPREWASRFGESKPQVFAYALEIFDPKRTYRNPSVHVTRHADPASVDGKSCTVYDVTFDDYRPAGAPIRPVLHHTRRCWVWDGGGSVVLKSEMRTESSAKDVKHSYAERSVMLIRGLDLAPRLDGSMFSVPAGTTVEVFSGIDVRLPAGVNRRVVQGEGLRLE